MANGKERDNILNLVCQNPHDRSEQLIDMVTKQSAGVESDETRTLLMRARFPPNMLPDRSTATSIGPRPSPSSQQED